jgi:MoaA/NifB/PqqE/SkfB family radical SAM enzyme
MKIVKFYERGSLENNELIVQWNLGNTCNYACEYCPSYLHSGKIQWPELSLIKDTLIKIKNNFPDKVIRLEFLGGEVTLYNHFIELMKFCKEHNFNSTILSNGSRTIRYWEELSPYLDRILLTFHAEEADQTHFSNVIDSLVKNKIEPIIHIAMIKDKFWELVSYKNQLTTNFPNVIIDSILMMDKLGLLNYNGYYYDYDNAQIEYVKQQEFHSMSYIVEYDNGEMREVSLIDVREQNLNNFSGFTCGTSLSIIVINFNGYVSTSLCNQRPKINVHTEDINQIFVPIICATGKCLNPSDIRIMKIKK